MTPLSKPPMSWPSVAVLGIVVAIRGLASYVLPPLLFPDASPKEVYGHPLIPWFAMAYGRFRLWPTMCPLFVVGAFAGAVQPSRWLLLGLLTISLPPILHAINVTHDIIADPTSHNLFPFEFAIIGFTLVPALAGAFLGSRLWG